MNALELLRRKRVDIERLCRSYGVVRLRVFGSAATGSWEQGRSDIGLVADFADPSPGIDLFGQQFGLLVQLERLLGCPVDLVDWAAAKGEYFREVVEEQAVDLYAA